MSACCESRELLDKAVAWGLRMQADGHLIVWIPHMLHRLGYDGPPKPEPYRGWDAGWDPPDIIEQGREAS